MPEPKDIVTSNFENYNKKLVFQDGILLISLLFILVNYFLIIEPNYSTNQERQFTSKKIANYNKQIDNYKIDIIKQLPDSKGSILSLKESDFKNEASVIEKLNLAQDSTALADTVKRKIGSIQSVIDDKKVISKKNDDLKKKIAESKDAMSLVKILVFVNDGSEHFALFLSFVVITVLIYFYLTRKYLLNLLARTLRIEKENELNKYYEYALSYSIWLTPIPNESSYAVSADDLLKVLAIKNSHGAYKKVMAVCFTLLTLLQFRLYFIELNTNDLSLNFYSILSLILSIATGLLCYFWITQKFIPDNFNSEEELKRRLSRREFVAITASAMPIIIVALGIPTLKHLGQSAKSSKIYNRLFNKPRYVSKTQKTDPAKIESKAFEQKCLDFMTEQKYDDCINLLMPEVIAKINSKSYVKQQQAVRLSSLLARVLLFVIHRKEKIECEKTFEDFTDLLKKSNNETLKRQANLWDSKDYKWVAVFKDKKNIIKWNNCIFT